MITLLYVDDEPVLLELAREILENSGAFSVDTRASATEALQALETRHYDAIVSDYQMPEMDGLAFLKQVRRKYGSIPFIMLTGRGEEKVVIRALNSGADFYLLKEGDSPALFIELSNILKQCVAIRESWKNILEREERYHDIQNANDLIQSVDPEGRFLFVNRKWCETLGYTERDLPNLRIFDIIHPESLDHCMSTFRRVIAGENVGIIDAAFLTRDGKRVYVEGMADCRMKDGKPQYTRGLFKDVTDRRRTEAALRESEERFRALVETTRDIVWETDIQDRLTYVSPQVKDILGYLPEEVIGHSFFDFMPPEEAARVRSRTATDTGSEKPLDQMENMLLHRDGRTIILETSGEPIRSAEGRLQGYRGISRDISERKRAAERIRENEQYLTSLLESVPSGVIVVDAATHTILQANPAALALFGAEEKTVLGKICHDFICPAMNGHCPISDKGMQIERSERTLIDANGQRIPVLKSVARAVLNGRAVFIETFVDISDRKRIEEALRESEERFRSLVDSSDDVIMRIDSNHRHMFVSPAIERQVGIKSSQFIGKTHRELGFPPELVRAWEAMIDSVISTGRKVMQEYLLPNGLWVDIIAVPEYSPDGSISGVIMTGRDITDRKKAEQALRESEEKFRSLVEYALDGILILDLQGTILFGNRAAAQTIGADDPALFLGKNVMEFIAKDSQTDVLRDFREVSLGHDGYLAQYRAVTVSGGHIWIESIGKMISYEGKPADLVSIRDITGRKIAEDSLRGLSSYNRRLIEASLDPLVTINHEGKISDVNLATETITGLSRQELIGTDFSDYFTEPEKARAGYRTVFRDGVIHDYLLEIRHRDGHITPVLYNASVYRNEQGESSGVFAAARDITERRQAEEALKQVNKKLSMLASITRHDIRNKLMLLRAYIYMAEKKATDQEVLDFLAKQESAAAAISHQIEFTKDYESLGVSAPSWQDIGGVIAHAGSQFEMGEVTINNEIAGIEIFADAMLSKVFYNLIDNSARYGETLTQIRIHAQPSSSGLTLVYEDNGVGIADIDKDQIFARGFGKNTGLGLFLSREILSITGIAIRECGVPGRGARFEMAIPTGAFRSTPVAG